MSEMFLHYFTNESDFPFYIQYGLHEEPMFLHSHKDFFELVIVLEGSATHVVDDEKYTISQGDVFVIGHQTVHGYTDTDNLRICNLMFRPDFFDNPSFDVRSSPGFHALFILEPYISKEHSFKSRLKLNLLEYNRIQSAIAELIQEYNSKPAGYRTFFMCKFMELVVRLSRLYELAPELEKGNLLSLSVPVAYMEHNFCENITLDSLAAQAGFSVRHFTRLFQNAYHTPPTAYLMKLRLQKATTLLSSTSLSVSEVAFQSGFEDSNYFTRQFRKHYGVTPSQFRHSVHNTI